MIPQDLRPLFGDTNLDRFDPVCYPAFAIALVLENGDDQGIRWGRDTFSKSQIVEVLRTEQRLSRKSANFWGLVYQVPAEQIAAVQFAT